MVQAILDGRKTVTRRAVKYKYSSTEMKMHSDKYGTRLIEIQKNIEGETHGKNPDGSTWHKLLAYIEPNPPYQPGDILYVRETWSDHYVPNEEDGKSELQYCYKADGIDIKAECLPGENNRWYPSIHMPKAAARIFLKVTDVRIERLQDIKVQDILKEGEIPVIHLNGELDEASIKTAFIGDWNSTIKESELNRSGWEANPWVWVIEFERIIPK